MFCIVRSIGVPVKPKRKPFASFTRMVIAKLSLPSPFCERWHSSTMLMTLSRVSGARSPIFWKDWMVVTSVPRQSARSFRFRSSTPSAFSTFG